MKLKKFKDWKIFWKVLTIVFTTNILFIGLFEIIIFPLFEKNLMESKKENVQHTVEVAYGVLLNAHSAYKNGALELTESMERAKTDLNELRYNEHEYFFVINDEPEMIMHPIKPDMNGSNLSSYKDPNGTLLFVKMAEVAKREAHGFVNYMWAKPGYTDPQPKISFIKYFKEWNWIIGSGIYIEDVQEELASLRNQAFTFIIIVSIIAFLITLYIARLLATPLKKINEAANKMASGESDVHVEIDSKDEIGNLSTTFNKMAEQIHAAKIELINEKQGVEKKVEEAVRQSNEQTQYLEESVSEILDKMDLFADGDLTVRLVARKEDQIGKLFHGFNKVVENIRAMIDQVSEAVQATASASNQISASTEEMAAGAQ
jgi:methyl-accepting chemotaxis protein